MKKEVKLRTTLISKSMKLLTFESDGRKKRMGKRIGKRILRPYTNYNSAKGKRCARRSGGKVFEILSRHPFLNRTKKGNAFSNIRADLSLKY